MVVLKQVPGFALRNMAFDAEIVFHLHNGTIFAKVSRAVEQLLNGV
jgi:hypothetical protein